MFTQSLVLCRFCRTRPAAVLLFWYGFIAVDAARADYATQLLSLNPDHYWRLNETSGTMAADEVAGGVPGTYENVVLGSAGPRPPAITGFEPDNNAPSFNGVDSIVTTGTPLLDNQSAFTMLGWFYQTENQSANRVGLFGQDGPIEFGFIRPDAIQLWTTATVELDIPWDGSLNNSWVFAAAVGDGTNSYVYLNGALAGSKSGPTSNYGSFPGESFNIGGDVFGLVQGSYNGFIDEVAVFNNRALTAEEIADLYDSAFTSTGDVLVSNLSEPVRDASPIGNNPNPVDPPEGPGAPWYWAAQSFQPDDRPYRLTSIEARVGDGSSAPPPSIIAELHEDNGGAIGPLMTTFTAPDVSAPPTEATFFPDSEVTLNPNTPYWFVLESEVPGDGTFFWQYADTGFSTGPGSLGLFADSTDSGVNWTYYEGSFPYFIQVRVTNADLPGDFDFDGDVDGLDFLKWQRGESPAPLSASDLAQWEANYGKSSSLTSSSATVPEPSGSVLVLTNLALTSRRWFL